MQIRGLNGCNTNGQQCVWFTEAKVNGGGGDCGSAEKREARAQLLCNHGQLHGLTGNFKGTSTTVFGVCQTARCWCRVNVLDHLPYCLQNSTWSSSQLLWKTQWCVNYRLHKRKKKEVHSKLSVFTEFLLKCKTKTYTVTIKTLKFVSNVQHSWPLWLKMKFLLSVIPRDFH